MEQFFKKKVRNMIDIEYNISREDMSDIPSKDFEKFIDAFLDLLKEHGFTGKGGMWYTPEEDYLKRKDERLRS